MIARHRSLDDKVVDMVLACHGFGPKGRARSCRWTCSGGGTLELLNRRGLLALAGSALVARALPAEAAARSFVAFGDSYTASYYRSVASWADQSVSAGSLRQIANLAYPGATAAGYNARDTFEGQVDRWLASYRKKGVPDRTIVYFGYNDVRTKVGLATPKLLYRRQIDRLVAAGVNSGSRRLVLCQIHDWSRNPGAAYNVRSRVKEWNAHVRSVAASHSNCQTVDLYGLFEKVFANPRSYGLSNVTTVDRSRSATTHLFADASHFGKKGQALIRSAIAARL